jgi:hypothetical protein
MHSIQDTLNFIGIHAGMTLGLFFLIDVYYPIAFIISIGPSYLINKTLTEFKHK